MKPKVFISYSWSDQPHREFVVRCAERLTADGVDVVLDLYDLQVGHDKYTFMERMVTDASVSHVLVFSDRVYSEKADARKAGVGTESQIISKEIYSAVEQSKFIPLVCEFAKDGEPFLPVFLKSRIWIDFSSPEAVDNNWEKLIRLLYGKPLYEKPDIGKAPPYVSNEEAIPSTPVRAKYESLRNAILQGKKGLKLYRREFLDACYDYADKLRVRASPNLDSKQLGEKVLQDCNSLTHIRDHLIDWVLLESENLPSSEFLNSLIECLEQLRELRSRPKEVTSWNEAWFEAHKLFGYETFLYVVAALLKTHSYEYLHEVFTTNYLQAGSAEGGDGKFARFHVFYAYSEILGPVLSPPGKKLYSPAAELVKRQANRLDIPFSDIVQADLLTLLIAFVDPEIRWYPQMLYYASYGREFPFFIRASQHKYFLHLATITGIADAEQLRAKVKEGHARLNVEKWHNFLFERNFWTSMNMEKLDTIK